MSVKIGGRSKSKASVSRAHIERGFGKHRVNWAEAARMKKLRRAGVLVIVCTGVVWQLSSLPALAADCEAQASGDWHTAATWTNCGGNIPQTGDNVTILGQSISVSAAIPSLASFRLEGGTLTAATGVDLVIETSRDISIVGGSTIDVVTGNMLFIANLGVTPTTGDFAGIVLQATTISAAGDMVCLGRGGDDAATTDHDEILGRRLTERLEGLRDEGFVADLRRVLPLLVERVKSATGGAA